MLVRCAHVGEMALLFSAPRSASVLCDDDECELVQISAADYKEVLKGSMQKTFRQRAKFLQTLPIFSRFHHQALMRIASHMSKEVYGPGQDVLSGSSGSSTGIVTSSLKDHVTIVEEGSLALVEAGSATMPPRCLLVLGKVRRCPDALR